MEEHVAGFLFARTNGGRRVTQDWAECGRWKGVGDLHYYREVFGRCTM